MKKTGMTENCTYIDLYHQRYVFRIKNDLDKLSICIQNFFLLYNTTRGRTHLLAFFKVVVLH